MKSIDSSHLAARAAKVLLAEDVDHALDDGPAPAGRSRLSDRSLRPLVAVISNRFSPSPPP
jgi:hypothetical protein